MGERNVEARRIKKAELVSGVGALVLGVGLGLLFSNFLKPYTFPALIVGMLMHAWGMFDKHRLENQTLHVRPWWEGVFYWICWAALLVLIMYIAVSYLRG